MRLLAVAGAIVGAAGVVATFPCTAAEPCSSGRTAVGSLIVVLGFQMLLLVSISSAYASLLAERGRQTGHPMPRGTLLAEGVGVAAVAVLVSLGVTTWLADKWIRDGFAGLPETRVLGILVALAIVQAVVAAVLSTGLAGIIEAARQARDRGVSTARVITGFFTSPAGIAVLLAVGFIAVSWWWLAMDTRPPTNDAARHLSVARADAAQFSVGGLTEPITNWNEYGDAPLVHLIGAAAILVGDRGAVTATLVLNLLFVPLLVLGCYGTAKKAFSDRRAGLLAVAFALGAPMVISQFKVFMVDAPLAGMVALTTWLILASDRFEHRGYTVAAGIAAGVGMMTKTIFPFYIVGLVAVVLLRGGWRNWQNLALVAVPALAIATPWAAINWSDLSAKVGDHLAGGSGWSYGGYEFASRWSLENFTYYAWSMVNHELLLPLTLFLMIGLVVALADVVRRRGGPASYAPELLVGLAGGYFLVSLLPLDDSRYILPLVVYAAVLGAGWIVRLSPGRRLVVGAALLAVVLGNTAVQNLGLGEKVAITIEQPNPTAAARNGEGTLVALNPDGFNTLGAPDEQARTLELIEAAKAEGVRSYHVVSASGLFSAVGFFRGVAEMPPTGDPGALGPDEMVIMLVRPGAPRPPGPPCTRWENGYAYYVWRGDTRRLPAGEYDLWCPLD